MDDPTAVEVVDCAENLDKQVRDMSLCVQISDRAQTRTQYVRAAAVCEGLLLPIILNFDRFKLLLLMYISSKYQSP